MDDLKFMSYALRMAELAVGTTAANPAVGCVIVKDNLILAASCTATTGRPHAETLALLEAGSKAAGATAYVTLEPCSHYGATPPCAESLIKAKIKRVVIASIDPNPLVNGKGIKMLEQAGIDVVTGVLESESVRINAGFFMRQTKNRPQVTLKIATSLDKKIAFSPASIKNNPHQMRWITSDLSRSYVHLMRAKSDAILTGIGTVIADDPMLNCRLPGLEKYSPIRVVLDTNLKIDPNCNLVRTAGQIPLWVVVKTGACVQNAAKSAILSNQGVKIIEIEATKDGRIDIAKLLQFLAAQSINNLMVEAGAELNTAFLESGLVDILSWFTAPITIGADGVDMVHSDVLNKVILQHIRSRKFGLDKFQVFSVKWCSHEI